MKKLVIAVALVLTFGACADGGDGGTQPDRTDDARSTDGRSDEGGSASTPEVKAAEEGEVNTPREGSYRYEYTSERTDFAKPDSTPQRADDDAELRRRVSVDGDVVAISDRTTEGPAVVTIKRRHADDGVYELSTELKINDQTAGCAYEEPVQILVLPLKAQELEAQSLAGEGSDCGGERTVKIEGPQETQDADGTTWTTWKYTLETTSRTATGVDRRNSLVSWFSPDLGIDVKVESVAEILDGAGEVAVRGASTQLLTAYPS